MVLSHNPRSMHLHQRLIRSASASSAQKQPNNTLKSGDLRRSMSDNSALKNPQRSPANSEIASPDDTEEEDAKPARGGGSPSHKTPKDRGSPVRPTDTRSSHKNGNHYNGTQIPTQTILQTNAHRVKNINHNNWIQTPTQTMISKSHLFHLQNQKMEVRERYKKINDWTSPPVMQPLVISICYVAPKHCTYVSCFVFTNPPMTNIIGSMLNAHTRKATNELIPAGNALFLYNSVHQIT
jgi:hypothetical protein